MHRKGIQESVPIRNANGGKLLRDLRLPDFREYAVDVPSPGAKEGQDMIELGGLSEIFLSSMKRPETSVSLDRTKRCLTDWVKFLKQPTGIGQCIKGQ